MSACQDEALTPRGAEPRDVEGIWRLLDHYASREALLPRDRGNIQSHLENFLVAEKEGRVVGCVAIRDFGKRLFEIRSLAVDPQLTGMGLGKALTRSALARLRTEGEARVFALTRAVGFFVDLGFQVVKKDVFPEKIWSDCDKCPNKDRCDEEAVLLDIRSEQTLA